MSRDCPHCGSPDVVGKGAGTVGLRRIEDGRAVGFSAPVRRVLCRSCGRNGTLYDEADRLENVRFRDHVVARTFALGQVGAHLETGLARGVVQHHLQAWAAAREPQVLDAAPDFLMLEPVTLHGTERVLVIDVDRDTLVEVLEEAGSLRGWLLSPGRPSPVKACLPVAPALHAAVAAAVPGARLMIAPAEARRALRVEADLALRALRRRPDLRRHNGMPTGPEFARALEPEGRVGEGWPGEAIGLRAAVQAVLSLLGHRRRPAAELALPAVEAVAARAPRILRWLGTWRAAILEGIANAFVDGTLALARSSRRPIATRRPTLGFADLRSLVLLRDFVRRDAPAIPGAPVRAVSEGRPLLGLPESLAPDATCALLGGVR